MKPKVGDTAPDFTTEVVAPGAEPESLKLSCLRGERVVLVFYPKDSTPGCTTQACDIRDGWGELKKRAKIYGVSVDDAKSHSKFQEKQSLPYPLISDTDKEIVEAYGVWVEKSMYGKSFMGTERTTFIIGPDGKIEAVMEKVKPKRHYDDLMARLNQLES